MQQESERVWVGIDWGDTEHAVTVVDGKRHVLEQFGVKHTPASLAEMVNKLRKYRNVGGVAVESHRGPLMVHLSQSGFVVYPINPKLSKKWREMNSVAECKSDKRDGRVLAQELAVRHEEVKLMKPNSDKVRLLTLMCEDEQKLIKQRTAQVQTLKSSLKAYFPGALSFFDDWTAPVAWAWLKRFPTAETLARAKAETLYAFLRTNRVGITDTWRARVESRNEALAWPREPALEEAYVMRVRAILDELRAIQTHLDSYRKRIEKLFPEHPSADVFSSLPGAGPKLAPRLACIFGDRPEEHPDVEEFRAVSGVAPVSGDSGKKHVAKMRRCCRKQWRDTLHMFAWTSTKAEPWALAFYKHRIASGDHYSLALRKLAEKWLGIIYRMWQTGSVYDSERHTNQLIKKKSPCVAYLAGG